jgi:alkaline phosphatase D
MDIACLILTGWFVARPLLNPHLDARVRILGSITHSEAKITFRNPRATSVYVEYWAVASHNTTLRTPQEHITNLTDYTVTIRLRNLTPSTTYFFRPVFSANSLMNGRENELHEELGNFTTLPPPLTPVDFSFSYGSCVIRSWTRNLEGFRSILQKNPNFALIIGDQIYSDNPVYFGPEKKYYEAKYREVLSDPYFAELAASKPLFHIFDDHELMNDWDKRQSPPYATAVSTWQQYVGNKNPDSFRSSSTNNIYHYYAFYYGNVAFFVMDTRSFRSPNRMPDSAEKTMLGAEQLHDLKYWLLSTQNSTIVFRFLVTSVPFTLNTALGDSWSSFKTEREDILNFIVSNRLNNCIILSGDAHWAGVFKIREGLYEFSTSPLDAFAAPNLLKNIDEQLFFDNRSRHQGFIQVSTTSSPPFVKYMLYGTNDNEPLFNLTLTPSQLVVS